MLLANSGIGAHVVLLCALCIAVIAQTNTLSECNGVALIRNTEDLDQLGKCSTWYGNDIVIFAPVSLIDLGNLAFVPIDLTFEGGTAAGDVSISADSLSQVNGTLSFHSISGLATARLANLQVVEDLSFTNVNFSEVFKFGAESVPSLRRMQTLEWVGTGVTSVGDGWKADLALPEGFGNGDAARFTAVDNPQLESITLPGYGTTPVNLNIQHNGADLDVYLPNVSNCALTLTGASTFRADNLTQIGLIGSAGSSITNTSLTNLTLPKLNTVLGNLNISNNADLKSIAFQYLSNVYGNITIAGNIESIDVGWLSDGGLQGRLEIDSQAFDCGSIDLDSFHYSCNVEPVSPSSVNNSDGNTDTSDGQTGHSNGSAAAAGGTEDSGLTTGAKAGIGVGIGLGIPLLLGLGYLFWRRSRKQTTTQSSTDRAELEGKRNAKHEVDGRSKRPELEDKHDTRHEMEEQRGVHELEADWLTSSR